MTRLACRRAMHQAEHIARMIADGSKIVSIDRHIADAREAYLATPELRVAQRLHVAMDQMEEAA